MHGADYDVRLLGRDLSIGLSGLVDTQIAAGLLGRGAIGLSAVLESRIGVPLEEVPEGGLGPATPAGSHAGVRGPRHGAPSCARRGPPEGVAFEGQATNGLVEEFRELEKVRFEEAGGRTRSSESGPQGKWSPGRLTA
jgi:hypothetical protein